VLKSDEMPLEARLEFERRNYCLAYATADQKEGMKAFLEKRKPLFRGESSTERAVRCCPCV